MSRLNLQKVNLHHNTRKNIICTSEAWLPNFPGEKHPGHGVSHSPPSSAEVNDEWRYTSIPPITFMAWTGTLLLLLCLIRKCLHCSINFISIVLLHITFIPIEHDTVGSRFTTGLLSLIFGCKSKSGNITINLNKLH